MSVVLLTDFETVMVGAVCVIVVELVVGWNKQLHTLLILVAANADTPGGEAIDCCARFFAFGSVNVDIPSVAVFVSVEAVLQGVSACSHRKM